MNTGHVQAMMLQAILFQKNVEVAGFSEAL